jgi:hypothetical protein
VTHHIQLEVGFVERAATDAGGNVGGPQPATQDSLWLPDGSDLGGREYLFLSRRAYSGAPNPPLAVDNAPNDDTDWLYAAWVKAVANGRQPSDGDVFRFVWGFIPGTPNDTIRFETRSLVRGNAALAKEGLGRIRVVPNPYYNRSRYELSQFNRIMRFTNLPEVATIRIFSLSGQLVRTLQKTDPTSSMLDWDLQTENRLPVASGVYVYHVDAPGVGTTFGRLVVFMEKERLNTF